MRISDWSSDVCSSDLVGGVIQEGAVFVDSASACQVEIDAHMHAAAAEMAVEGASVAVAVQECAKLAQIGADPIGSNRGVLPSPPGIGLPGHMRGGTETGFANFPDLALLVGIAQPFPVRLDRKSVG